MEKVRLQTEGNRHKIRKCREEAESFKPHEIIWVADVPSAPQQQKGNRYDHQFLHQQSSMSMPNMCQRAF